MTVIIDTNRLYGVDVPGSLWAESIELTAYALNRSAATADPGLKLLNKIFYG